VAPQCYTLTVQPKGMATLPGVVTFSATGRHRRDRCFFAHNHSGRKHDDSSHANHSDKRFADEKRKNARSCCSGNDVAAAIRHDSSRKRARRVRYLLAVVLLGVFSLGTVMGLAGCAGGSGGNQPPLSSTTYTIVVTATCGKLQHATNLTLSSTIKLARGSGLHTSGRRGR